MVKKATTRNNKSATVQSSKLQEMLDVMGVSIDDAKSLIIKNVTAELLKNLITIAEASEEETVTQKFPFADQVSAEIDRQLSTKVTELIESHIATAIKQVCIRETNKFGEPIDPTRPPMTLAELIESRVDKFMRRKVNKTTGKPSGAVGVSRVEYLVNNIMQQVVSDYAENIVSVIEQKLTNRLSKDVVNHVRSVIEQNMLSDK